MGHEEVLVHDGGQRKPGKDVLENADDGGGGVLVLGLQLLDEPVP